LIFVSKRKIAFEAADFSAAEGEQIGASFIFARPAAPWMKLSPSV
jgi:hypothetical protein